MRREIRSVHLVSGHDHNGPASIGWATFNRTGRTVHQRARRWQRIVGGGVRGYHRDVDTGEEYRVSDVKRNGQDRHRAGSGPVELDDDAREECERPTAPVTPEPS